MRIPQDPEYFKDQEKHFTEWLHYGGKPFRDFVPPGAFAWIGPMIGDLEKNWPWPYEIPELNAIVVDAPETSRENASRQIVHLARVYLGRAWAAVRGPKGKPNPTEELRRLKSAADELIGSIADLSPQATRLLETKGRLNIPGAPDTAALRFAVDEFLHEHQVLRRLPDPEPGDRRGRKVEALERGFQAELDQIFLGMHGGVRPKHGFPAFQKAVRNPLNKWHAVTVEDSSRRDLRRSPKRSSQQRRRKSAKTAV